MTAEMPERHTGINIANRLITAAEEWDITVIDLLHDNAAYAVFAAGWPHLGACVAHTLQFFKSGLEISLLINMYNVC